MRFKASKRNKVIILAVVIFLFVAIFLFYFWAKQEVCAPKDFSASETIDFNVVKGEGVSTIGRDLKERGIIKNSFIFQLYVVYRRVAPKLKAGEYSLSPSMNIAQIVNKLIAGEIVKKNITILEGWDLRDIASYCEAQKIFNPSELFKFAGEPAKGYLGKDNIFENDLSGKFEFLKDKPKNVGLEGYLFPDTYEIVQGEKSAEIIDKILANFGEKLSLPLAKEIEKQRKTIFEIVTMASIIEKEARTVSDKKIVSGILWKRLAANMPLQVDSSINYAIDKSKPSVSYNDLLVDSPYNTYRYKGLPIGPICNPGIESIEAAIYPKTSNYWYYLSTPAGKIIFSRTLSEHNIAKARYLK